LVGVVVVVVGIVAASEGDGAVYISELSSSEAHAAALVNLTVFDPNQRPDRLSYSGYVTVESGAQMFVWFVEADIPLVKQKDVPVVLWLQGGPGCADTLGFFEELGPFLLLDTETPVTNPYAWSRNFHNVFIDNPVGSGFSYGDLDTYVAYQPEAARNLEQTLGGFFAKFSEYGANPLFIFGESYAGKWVPSLASYLLTYFPDKYNLQGVGIGDGLTNPYVQIAAHADHLESVGLVFDRERLRVDAYQAAARSLVEEGNYVGANVQRNDMFEYIENITGNVNLYNFLQYNKRSHDPTVAYLNRPEIRMALHVGSHTFAEMCNSEVKQLMSDDIMRSTAWDVEIILASGLRALFYQGQLDLRDGYPEVLRMLRALKWSGGNSFNVSPSAIWRGPDGDVSGYVRSYSNLMQVVIVGAGHLAPQDKPQESLDMLTRFVMDLPFV